MREHEDGEVERWQLERPEVNIEVDISDDRTMRT